MKHTLLSFLLLASGICVNAQSYDSAIRYRLSPSFSVAVDTLIQRAMTLAPDDTGEDSKASTLSRYKSYMVDRISYDVSAGTDMTVPMGTALSAYSSFIGSCSGSGDWHPLGPFTNYYGVDDPNVEHQGRINAIWVNPLSGSILAGADGGGLWKSTNDGHTWHCITDYTDGGLLAMPGVTCVVVDPLNRNTIFLGTRGSDYGSGILESFDGGNTWQQEFIPSLFPFSDSIESIQNVFFTPDSTRIYAFIWGSLFTRYNVGTGNVWQNITPTGTSAHAIWYNLKFTPGDQNHFFISNTVGDDVPKAGIWESFVAVPASSDWTNITVGLTATLTDYASGSHVTALDTDFITMDISVPTSDTLFAIGMYVYNNRYAGLWKYNLSGTRVWTLINGSMPFNLSPPVPQYSRFEFAVSPAATTSNNNHRNIYFGSDVPFCSYDEGFTFTQIGTYYGTPTHADVRSICLQTSTNTLHGAGDIVFFATDGGVSKKRSGMDA
jgi:hypothetical protein